MGISRRSFLAKAALGGLVLSPAAALASCTPANRRGKSLGIALVGLGSYSEGQLAPALQQTQYCHLAGIVTGTPAKAAAWKQRYRLDDRHIYNYETFDRIADDPAIDIVYVVLPIFLHHPYTIRAARAGKHVICEKPMAMNVRECDEMIDACRDAGVLLSIGYRLHFEPYNLEMMRLGQQQVYGPVRRLNSSNGYIWGDNWGPSWRLRKAEAGGGPLMDMGVYVVQGCRYTTGEEPLWVEAREEKTRPQLFTEVEETVHWTMQFPGGAVATCHTSYNGNGNHLRAETDTGWFELSSAYRYGGMVGATHEGPMRFNPNVNQQAAQMDDFARCILEGKPTRVPGEMGRLGMKVIEAIYRSLQSGKRETV